MASVDQTGGGFGNYVIVSYEHPDGNRIPFNLRNTSVSAASFWLRWIWVN